MNHALEQAVGRLEAVLHEETNALKAGGPVDLSTITVRKNQSLLELTRLTRSVSANADDAQTRERLAAIAAAVEEKPPDAGSARAGKPADRHAHFPLDRRCGVRRNIRHPSRLAQGCRPEHASVIKLIAIGVWVLAVALGSNYAMSALRSSSPDEPEKATYFDGIDYCKTTNITIPMIADDAIQGYILARFVYTIDGKTGSELKVPPDPFILDEAFRRIYSTDGFDFDKPSRFDLTALTAFIKSAVNERYGEEIVKDILVDQFDYIAKKDIRNGRPEAG